MSKTKNYPANSNVISPSGSLIPIDQSYEKSGRTECARNKTNINIDEGNIALFCFGANIDSELPSTEIDHNDSTQVGFDKWDAIWFTKNDSRLDVRRIFDALVLEGNN